MLVAIMDADKEGFLRSERSLIQTIGRAARNAEAKVIMYADNITDSMKNAIETTENRRRIQDEYNKKHGIVPKTIIKGISNTIEISSKTIEKEDKEKLTRTEILKEIERLKFMMDNVVKSLDFESAIKLRDKISELKLMLDN
jgi:excinuclease ABC subunit B